MSEPQYFVCYTVLRGENRDSLGARLERLRAGPYTMDEALVKKREFDNGNAINVHIEEA